MLFHAFEALLHQVLGAWHENGEFVQIPLHFEKFSLLDHFLQLEHLVVGLELFIVMEVVSCQIIAFDIHVALVPIEPFPFIIILEICQSCLNLHNVCSKLGIDLLVSLV